ncbi:tetratricopeptide repeat protein [Flavobacterium sp.]|uniref:tetratricopeptide repeat protein n=1 Tax=Flavobacterium sp. TaxID=239 RepID=UPI002B4B4CA2|nr:tetratricopeptide repeat protein [Flavobacterium sp.]HLP64696.1 tetratricopeptide repeat protein [Flavobacterium sp.]
MYKNKSLPIINFWFFSLLFFALSGFSQSKNDCDSLIKTGIDLMWKKKHEKSLELLIQAKNIAEKNRWYKQYFDASNTIGGNYYLMLDYGEALHQYMESYKIAIAHLDESHEMIVLNNIAILFSKEEKLDKAMEYFLKAYTIAKKRNDFVKTGYYAVNLGSVLNEMNQPLAAQKYIDESLQYLTKQPDVLYLASIVQAENELLLGKTVSARSKAMALLQKPNNKFSRDNQVVLFIIIAKSYLKERNIKSSLEWSSKALSSNTDLEKKTDLFNLLSTIHQKQKKYELALLYKDSVFEAERKLNALKNGRSFENSQIRFQLQNYKREIDKKEVSIKNERLLYFGLISVIFLVLLIVLLIFRNQTIKNKQCQTIALRNHEITLLKLQKEKDDNLLFKRKEAIALLEQDRLKKEIELRNQKIAAKALYLSGKDQLLQEILKSLGKAQEISKNSPLKNHIQELKRHLNTENDWNSFILHFEEVNQGLLQKLMAKHSNLNQNDLRFISYEYMNLSTKEIATLLNITLDACRKRKERIVAKLGLESDTTLRDYLSII